MAQMYANMLNPTKGWPTGPLDYTAKQSANCLYKMRSGQVGHLNASGDIEPGVVAWQMPLFCFYAQKEVDVGQDAVDTPGTDWYPVTPSQRFFCIVGKAAVELWTTEFDTTQTYLPNQPLRAPTGNALVNDKGGGGTLSGALTNQGVIAVNGSSANYTNVCGIATGPAYTNKYGVSVLPFWPVWYPGNTAES
jgi:hypothetical protein